MLVVCGNIDTKGMDIPFICSVKERKICSRSYNLQAQGFYLGPKANMATSCPLVLLQR
jgi:hypothetical protein